MTVRRLSGCDGRKVVDGIADRRRPSSLWLRKLVSKAEFSIDPNHEQSMPKLRNAVVGGPQQRYRGFVAERFERCGDSLDPTAAVSDRKPADILKDDRPRS
jgi:hypothetical protein